MHESEAMDFIASVLRGFMERIYKMPFKENKKIYFSLDTKIRDFVHDENGHWVQVKAKDIIDGLEDLETDIANGGYKPDSFELCIDIVLQFAEKTMQDRIDVFITEINETPNYLHDFFPLPLLPKH